MLIVFLKRLVHTPQKKMRAYGVILLVFMVRIRSIAKHCIKPRRPSGKRSLGKSVTGLGPVLGVLEKLVRLRWEAEIPGRTAKPRKTRNFGSPLKTRSYLRWKN